jgi:uncharacterized membrane protein
MNSVALRNIIGLGTITGMRSMAGPATLALARGGLAARVASLFAAGEFVGDKTSFVGNRTDAVPLAGRAAMGALVGGVIAYDEHESVLAGALIGATTAVIAAHLAYQVRTRLLGSTVVGGLVEDAIVTTAGAAYLRNRRS